MKTTNFLIALSTSVLALTIPSLGTTLPAAAHTACRIDFPFGSGWTEGCPHPHPHLSTSSGTHSCLAVFTSPASYLIENRTENTVFYSMNSVEYELSPGYVRTHEIGGGSNGCNTVSTAGRIEFDWSYDDGYQQQSYLLEESDEASGYYFSSLPDSNGISFYLER